VPETEAKVTPGRWPRVWPDGQGPVIGFGQHGTIFVPVLTIYGYSPWTRADLVTTAAKSHTPQDRSRTRIARQTVFPVELRFIVTDAIKPRAGVLSDAGARNLRRPGTRQGFSLDYCA
jgi:hypothetical protein